MTDISLRGNSIYEEDISTLAAGTELIGAPCVIWDITVCLEANADATVNFSNSTTAYDSSERIKKVVLDGPGTIHLVFSKGLYCSAGLCVTSNVSSVDVSVDYD